jgi:hypothetical protein
MKLFKKSTLLIIALGILSYAPLAFAACSGTVTSSGCSRCPSTLWLTKKPYVKITTYYTGSDGTCKTDSVRVYGDCGKCS